jgi:hypothetical protein
MRRKPEKRRGRLAFIGANRCQLVSCYMCSQSNSWLHVATWEPQENDKSELASQERKRLEE